jgi:hypothetical protein
MADVPPPRHLYSDGRCIWYIDTIWALAHGLPEEDLALDQVIGLDEVCWFNETWGRKPTWRAVVDHCRRMVKADMTYPVIIAPDGNILDGKHRISRAMLEGLASVRAVRLPQMPPPDETLSPDDPRYVAGPRADS